MNNKRNKPVQKLPGAHPPTTPFSLQGLVQQALQVCEQQGIEAAVQWLHGVAERSVEPKVTPQALLLRVAQRIQAQNPRRALDFVERVLSQDASLTQAWVLSGLLQDRLGMHQGAREALRHVLANELATPEQVLTSANLLVRFGDDALAMKAAKAAYLKLGRPLRWADSLIYIALKTADWPMVDALMAQMTAAHAAGQVGELNESPRTHLLWCGDEAVNISVVRHWSATQLLEPAGKVVAPLPAPVPGRRLRVGYLSSDIREHPTARLANGLFRHHDRSAFELFLYCSGWDDGSEFRREVLSHFDHVHSVAQLENEAAAALIRAHQIDVLVELNGPTRANRMGILAHRPAPVQIDYLGWPGSVGGRVVDYVVGDAYTVPAGVERLYPEKVIRLHRTYQINDYAARQPLPVVLRSAVGLPDGDVRVLGMFNSVNKVRAEVWATWMQILQAVPNAILWMLDPGPAARKNIALATRQHGIDPRRVLAAPSLKQDAHLARLQCCDLMLDPWPYGGHTSTSDALFAGVPVIALQGKNFAGRVSGGLLRAAGLHLLEQPDVRAYVNMAVRLLREPAALQRVKRFVAEQVPKSDVFDAESKTRQLEAAYCAAVERASKGLAPVHIDLNGVTSKPVTVVVIDPGLSAQPGHHLQLNGALYEHARAAQLDWRFLGHRSAPALFPLEAVFRGGIYVDGRGDWLNWLQRTTSMAATLAQDLLQHVSPLLDFNRRPALLLHSATLPLLLAMARWLELLQPGHFPASIGLHFHVKPDFGTTGWKLAESLAKDAVSRIGSSAARAALPIRVTVQHATLASAWRSVGLERIEVAPTPSGWRPVRRTRAADARISLLFIGPPRTEKGFALLIESLPALLRAVPELDVCLICADSDAHRRSELLRLQSERVSVQVLDYIPDESYYAAVADADVVFCAYSPTAYAAKASNVFWEAQATGVPALLTSGMASEQDFLAVGARGAVVLEAHGTDQLIGACRRLCRDIDRYRSEANRVSQHYIDLLSGRRWYDIHAGIPTE